MVRITNTTQLSTFSMVRNILLANTILAKKFQLKDFYEFEPKHKSTSFSGFPYIWIDVPDTNEADNFLGEIIENKEFDIKIILRMDYEARANFSSYASIIISELTKSDSTFQASGYALESVKKINSDSILMDQKQLVEGEFELILQGEVAIQ